MKAFEHEIPNLLYGFGRCSRIERDSNGAIQR